MHSLSCQLLSHHYLPIEVENEMRVRRPQQFPVSEQKKAGTLLQERADLRLLTAAGESRFASWGLFREFHASFLTHSLLNLATELSHSHFHGQIEVRANHATAFGIEQNPACTFRGAE